MFFTFGCTAIDWQFIEVGVTLLSGNHSLFKYVFTTGMLTNLPVSLINTFAFAFGSLWNIWIICSDYTELKKLLDSLI